MKYFTILNFMIINTSLSNKPPFSHQKSVQGVMTVEAGTKWTLRLFFSMDTLWFMANTDLPIKRSQNTCLSELLWWNWGHGPSSAGWQAISQAAAWATWEAGHKAAKAALCFAPKRRQRQGLCARKFLLGRKAAVCVLSRADLRNLNSWCPIEVTDQSCDLRLKSKSIENGKTDVYFCHLSSSLSVTQLLIRLRAPTEFYLLPMELWKWHWD